MKCTECSKNEATIGEFCESCYNDSMKNEILIYDVWDGSKFHKLMKPRNEKYIPMESNFIKDTIYYTHKEPTFIDFIDWLKKLQKNYLGN